MTTTADTLTNALESALDHIDDGAENDLTTSRTAPSRPEKLPPYVAALPIAGMIIDHTYQRDPNTARVDAMVAEFDPTLLGVLEVSLRDNGDVAILDGQHRLLTARQVDPAMHLVCNVHRGLTVEGEAAVFYDIDVRRKPLSGWDRWKARRGSGDSVVTAIEDVVNKFDGVQIAPYANDGAIAATKALETVYTAGGAALLSSALTLIMAAWGTARDAFNGQLIQAVAIVHETYDMGAEIDADRLVSQMQVIAPRQVIARAQALREAHRAEAPRLCAAVLIDRYNAGQGRNVEPLLVRAPASSKLLSKAGNRTRELAAIRRWAVRNGHDVSERGRLSQAVVLAYAEAHPGFALSSK